MYFVFLFTLIAFIFRNAFSTYFFSDDFFFLKISHIDNFQQFINFFSPIRQVSYKPVSQEVLYFLIHLMKENVFLAHLLVFIVYFIGLYYLYKIIHLLTKNKPLSYLTIFIYGINFTHVFQLYYLAAFQDIAIFTFLSLSFYHLLVKKRILSILFFILALLSKETAILFIPFLILFKLLFNKKVAWKSLIYYLLLGLIFTFIYQYSLKYVTAIDNYRITFNPHLAINNSMWYFLWGLGTPNFTSLYFTSIFRKPIPEFWKMLTNFPEIKTYYALFISYYLLLIISIGFYLLKDKKKLSELFNRYLIAGLIGFFTFLGPILLFKHRWMIRLAVPLIFISLIQSFLIFYLIKSKGILKISGILLIGFYFYLQLLGISIHESSSTFLLESRFTKNAKEYFKNHIKEITKHRYIYFLDKTKIVHMPWGGSKKLKVTLSDQNFINHYFPNSNIKAVYGFEDEKIPNDSYIINSFDILLPK